MELYGYAAFCWAIGGLINGFAGFGAALIAMPLVTQRVDLVFAVPSCTLIGISLCVQMGWTYRKSVDWKRLRPLLIGSLPGAVAGATVLSTLPEVYVKCVMACFLFVYAMWGLFFEHLRSRTPISSRWGYLAGFGSTAVGTAVGMAGPPAIVYTSLAGWSQDAIKAGIASFFLCASTVMIAVQVGYGLHSQTSSLYFVACFPVAALGNFVGVRLSRRVGECSYRKVLHGLLLIMALVIGYSAFPQVFSVA